MNNDTVSNWLKIMSVAGLMASLVLVGLELRRPREIAIANVYK